MVGYVSDASSIIQVADKAATEAAANKAKEAEEAAAAKAAHDKVEPLLFLSPRILTPGQFFSQEEAEAAEAAAAAEKAAEAAAVAKASGELFALPWSHMVDSIAHLLVSIHVECPVEFLLHSSLVRSN